MISKTIPQLQSRCLHAHSQTTPMTSTHNSLLSALYVHFQCIHLSIHPFPTPQLLLIPYYFPGFPAAVPTALSSFPFFHSVSPIFFSLATSLSFSNPHPTTFPVIHLTPLPPSGHFTHSGQILTRCQAVARFPLTL